MGAKLTLARGHCLHVKADSRNCGDVLVEFQLVNNCCFTSVVQPQHEDVPGISVSDEVLKCGPESREKYTHFELAFIGGIVVRDSDTRCATVRPANRICSHFMI